MTLTRAHRLAVIRELWTLAYTRGLTCGFRLLWTYEREASKQ